MSIKITPPGEITITSFSGLKLTLHPFGARVTSFIVPIDSGPKEIVESYPDLELYKSKRKYSGATIAPFANRIKNGQFSIANQVYSIDKNEGKNSLHSGQNGLHLQVWETIEVKDNEVIFKCKKAHLEDGFPGNRIFTCCYTLEEDDLVINFYAESDRATFVNMTNHSYFNLDQADHLENHLFMIDASGVLELDNEGIPTGSTIPAIGDFNLSTFQRLGKRVFDHNFILSNNEVLELAAAAYCPYTDITLEVYTDQPGLQFYTGNKKFFAFETQHFPDSPNHANFPSTLVTPDKPYNFSCIYRLNY